MMVMNDLLETQITDERPKQFIDIQKQQLDKMNWLIQNLLKLSKLDAGTVEVRNDTVSVKTVIEDSLRPFLLQMELREISLEKQVEEMTFRGDRNWTSEALQ